jgi:hypothetical protein
MAHTEIYCPQCRWKPPPDARWVCTPEIGGCGKVWDTFATGGVCPRCSWHWIITCCHACRQFSAHVDWYHAPEAAPAPPTHAGTTEDA